MSAATALRVEDAAARPRDAGLAITLRGLSKSFDGGAPVIRGLDLHVPAGQFVAATISWVGDGRAGLRFDQAIDMDGVSGATNGTTAPPPPPPIASNGRR